MRIKKPKTGLQGWERGRAGYRLKTEPCWGSRRRQPRGLDSRSSHGHSGHIWSRGALGTQGGWWALPQDHRALLCKHLSPPDASPALESRGRPGVAVPQAQGLPRAVYPGSQGQPCVIPSGECVCVCVFVHMCVFAHVCWCVHMCVGMHMYLHVGWCVKHVCTHVVVWACVCSCVLVCPCTCVCMHACARTCVSTRVCT